MRCWLPGSGDLVPALSAPCAVKLVLPPEDLVEVREVLDALGSVRPDDDQLVPFAVGSQPDFASQPLVTACVEPDHLPLSIGRNVRSR
jgi:hypothetical protein